MLSKLEEYYENYDENGRLQKDNVHKVEFLTTINYFDKLFCNKSRILDVCAGTGVYSFYLAEKGHCVTACDLVEHNVKVIRSSPESVRLNDIKVCNVLDLSCFQDKSFDIVLCMGALYHLKNIQEKERAVNECKRVLKPDGLLVLSYLNKFACIAANVNIGLTNIDEAIAWYKYSFVDDSVFTLTTPEEMSALEKRCGLEAVHRIGADGVAYIISEKLNNANNDNFNKWMEYHFEICEEPSILGASIHGLDICKKK